MECLYHVKDNVFVLRSTVTQKAAYAIICFYLKAFVTDCHIPYINRQSCNFLQSVHRYASVLGHGVTHITIQLFLVYFKHFQPLSFDYSKIKWIFAQLYVHKTNMYSDHHFAQNQYV